MTLREIADTVTAYTAEVKRKRRERQRGDYALAQLFNLALLAPKQFPEFDEFYPDEEADHSADWKKVRDHMRSAAAYNTRKRGERIDD